MDGTCYVKLRVYGLPEACTQPRVAPAASPMMGGLQEGPQALGQHMVLPGQSSSL